MKRPARLPRGAMELAARIEAARRSLQQDGVCIVRQALPPAEVNALRTALEDIFGRDAASQRNVGARTDMTAAAAKIKEQGHGDKLLLDIGVSHGDSAGTAAARGRYLTEIDAGRWHQGLRAFELRSSLAAVVAAVLGEETALRFFMDHCFLKEAGSGLRTDFHQDAPYFPFECSSSHKAAVCWVPVDPVEADSGMMVYVKGSHTWAEHAPTDLISSGGVLGDAHGVPLLPDIDAGVARGDYKLVRFGAVQPGDIIIHHPNTVHGSGGNTSPGRRRLAASIRYVGSSVTWRNKPTLPKPGRLGRAWAMPRIAGWTTMASMTAQRLGRAVGLVGDDAFYEASTLHAYREMIDGEPLDARDVARVAFPVVWQSDTALKSKL